MGNVRIVQLLFRRSFIFFMFFATTVSAATEVKISARLVKDEIPMNRDVHLIVSASWNGASNEIKFFPIDPPTTTNLKLVSTSTANIVQSDKDGVSSIRQYEFIFRGETLGMAYIDEVILRYHDADLQENVLRTARLPLKIIDPVRENSGLTTENVILILVFFGLFGAIFTFYYWKKKNRDETGDEPLPVKSNFQEAVDDLRDKINLQTSDINGQYAEISRIMWRYLRHRFDLQPAVGTTEELMRKLEANKVSLDDRAALQEMMQACDLAKFSGGGTDPNQLVRIYEIAKQLVEKLEYNAAPDPAE